MILSILTAIRTALLADGTLVAITPYVYSLQAPEDATLPYIVLTIQSGGESNLTEHETFDVTVAVICVSEDALVAATAADRIRTVLHDASLTLTGGWTLWSAGGCSHRTAILYSENEERRTFSYAGGQYRIRGHASS